MKIIHPKDVVINTTSDFDWEGFVDTFDWDAFYLDCSLALYGKNIAPALIDEKWGFPVKKGGYRLVSLELPLAVEDIAVLEEQYDAFRSLEDSDYCSWQAFKLSDNLLFVVNYRSGCCHTIVRIERNGKACRIVEFLEDIEHYNESEPYSSASFLANMLSDLLPAPRFDVIDRNDWDKGFCWKDANDPEHELKQGWY